MPLSMRHSKVNCGAIFNPLLVVMAEWTNFGPTTQGGKGGSEVGFTRVDPWGKHCRMIYAIRFYFNKIKKKIASISF